MNTHAIVFGSLNIDRVYPLTHLPETGEMIRSGGYEIHVGGKGLNQALALKKAGFTVAAAGQVGADGDCLTGYLDENGVDTSLIGKTDGYSGHAVIMIDPEGRNQMIIYPGANREIGRDCCDRALEMSRPGDLLVMQYETNGVKYMMTEGKKRGLTVVFNPSPFVPEIKDCPFECVDYLFINEQEGALITGKTAPEEMVAVLLSRYADMKIFLTLGPDGAVYADKNGMVCCSAFPVNAVDTTGAGDTFTGFSLFALASGKSPRDALKTASAASAIVVTRKGAAETIPSLAEVESFLAEREQECSTPCRFRD